MQAPAALFGGWHRPSCEHHLGCTAEIFFQLSCDGTHFSKVERCAFISSSLRKCLTFTREETLTGFQSGCCDSIIQHCLDFFYRANSKSHPGTQLFSSSARPLVYLPAGVSVTTSCCWQMLLRENSSSQTLPTSPSRSIRCMTARTSRRRDK